MPFKNTFLQIPRASSFRPNKKKRLQASLQTKQHKIIIQKYYNKGMIFQNPKTEDQWAYWERVPEMVPKVNNSLVKKDQQNRIDKK